MMRLRSTEQSHQMARLPGHDGERRARQLGSGFEILFGRGELAGPFSVATHVNFD